MPLAALKIETRITAATSFPAAGPKSAATASAATRSVAATPRGPERGEVATFASR